MKWLAKLLFALPRIFSFLVYALLIALFFFSQQDGFLFTKILILVAFLTVTVISWKIEAIGGSLFVILGAIFFIVYMGIQLPPMYLVAVGASFITGMLFIIDHLFREKKDSQEEVDF